MTSVKNEKKQSLAIRIGHRPLFFKNERCKTGESVYELT